MVRPLLEAVVRSVAVFGVFFFLFLSLARGSAATPAPESVLEGVSLSFPVKVSLQGGVGYYPDGVLTEVFSAIKMALQAAQNLAPKGPDGNLFHWATDPTSIGPVEIQLVLTDSNQVEGLATGPLPFTTYTLFLGSPNSSQDGFTHRKLVVALRIDKLFMAKAGGFRGKHAYFETLAGLLNEISGPVQFYLQMPQSEFKSAIADPRGNSSRVMAHSILTLENLTRSPTVLSYPFGGLDLSATLMQILLQAYGEGGQSPRETRPFSLPWTKGPVDSYGGMPQAILDETQLVFAKSLALVLALPPDGDGAKILKGKGPRLSPGQTGLMRFFFLDTRLPVPPRYALHFSFVGELPLQLSESSMAYSTADADFRIAFYLNRIVYDEQRQLRPHRLAKMAVALAAELYGASLILEKSVPDQSDLGVIRFQRKYFDAGMRFVERLRASAYWRLLTDEESAGFENVAQSFQSQDAVNATCIGLLMAKAGGQQN